MKKSKEGMVDLIINIILCVVILLCIYIEINYDLSGYIWLFNSAILVLLPIYYFIINILEKLEKRKIENKTIIKNIDFKYYREIIDGYSPAVLSFILDGTEIEKDLSASMIYLLHKGYLEYTEENKLKKTSKDMEGLSEDLQYICNNCNKFIETLKHKSDKKENYAEELKNKWTKLIEKQAKENELVVERKTFSFVPILVLVCIIEAIYTLFTAEMGLFIFSVILIFILIGIKMYAFDENKFVKTQKGYEIYKKIIGLKNYVKDYSMLDESTLEQITLWEDYLIYAIIFNETSKLNKQALEFYNKLFE